MVRLMQHAADHLQGQIKRLIDEQRWANGPAISAMAYSRAVLQMVAASVSPEGDELINRLTGYSAWVDQHDDAAPLTTAEVASVARYLREVKV